jgi:hypothetical protein
MFRPTGVTILGVLVYICAASLFIAGIVSVVGGIALIPSHVPGSAIEAIVGVGYILLAALHAIAGYGLMELKNWGRMLTIGLIALGLAANLIDLARSLSIYLVSPVVVSAYVLWYLFQFDVRKAFGDFHEANDAPLTR